MTKKYYDILEISSNATLAEIKTAYKKLALKWHPDRNRGNEAVASEKFKKIGEAYEVLSNPTLKAEYDRCNNDENFSPPPTNHSGGLGTSQNSINAIYLQIKEDFKAKFDSETLICEVLGSEFLPIFGHHPSHQLPPYY
jgi:curved DNA-binding protein CbpA